MEKGAFKKPPLVLIGVIALMIALGLAYSPIGENVDTFFYDSLFFFRGALPPSEDIVIVSIDEASFGVLKHQWPWPRSLHARLIDSLYEAGVKTVALDLIFSEASIPKEDQVFSECVGRHPSLILGADIQRIDDSAFSQESLVTPHPSLMGPQTHLGVINLPVEQGGVIRTIPSGESFPQPLSVVAAKIFSEDQSPSFAPLGCKINYLGPIRTLTTRSYYQALEPATHLPPGFLKGKLVFVGFSTQNTADIENTRPDHFPAPYTRWGEGYMPGVEIHATIAQNLITQTYIKPIPFAWRFLVSTLLAAGMGLLFFRMKPLAGSIMLICSGTLFFLIVYYLFCQRRLYLPMVPFGFPLITLYLASPFGHYLTSRREKNFIRRAFSTYVSPSVVQQLISHPEQLTLGGEEREITAFFSDLQGFTTISEQLRPQELVELLNEFLTEMTEIILAHEGTVDKFEGDAIIAMFGAPNRLENHALAACKASIEMQKRMTLLRERFCLRGFPELHMRIGLCSGKAVVGNMGSRNRMDYTMMGDTVNTASRLEGANKIYGIFTLIAQSTYMQVRDNIVVREIDAIRLKGKKESILTYELVGYTGEVNDTMKKMLISYEKGLEEYRNRSWEKAISNFKEALSYAPNDGPSRTMIIRCTSFNENPPESEWDGTYIMTTK